MTTEPAGPRRMLPAAVIQARRWLLTGRVQGVGFRPFAYRLARASGIRGFVQNRAGQVEIVGEGPPQALMEFGRALLADAPPFAQVRIASCSQQAPAGHAEFRILPSEPGDCCETHLPPDGFCCDDCLRELDDPRDRRFRYPFINCTQCGPRYTLISALPYDRANTSMAGFAMCAACHAEYEDPGDRRFHAEPVACPACGPRLSFHTPGSPVLHGMPEALAACVDSLCNGRIVAPSG